MRYIKSVGLALALLAAVALVVAAAPASATVLCKVAFPSTCGFANHLGPGTKISSHLKTGTRAVLSNEFGEEFMECQESTFDLITTNTGGIGQTVTADTETFSWGNCSNVAPVVLKKPTLVLHWTTGNNGTITESGLEISVGPSCTYGALGEQTVGPLTGGNPAQIDMNIVLARITGIICPPKLSFQGIYEVTSPKPLYVTAS
jgi:hypothetical protein